MFTCVRAPKAAVLVPQWIRRDKQEVTVSLSPILLSPCLHPLSPHLAVLLIVQGLGVGVWLADQGVHEHQERHVEQQGPHHRQVDNDDHLQLRTAQGERISSGDKKHHRGQEGPLQLPLMCDLLFSFCSQESLALARRLRLCHHCTNCADALTVPAEGMFCT